jgi:hypothetical protein
MAKTPNSWTLQLARFLDMGYSQYQIAVAAYTANLDILPPPQGMKRERELRILNAFDVERCCI